MTFPTDDLGNPQVDFVWGPFPLQPNDQRGENTLDPTLDNHIIATSGYEGFPNFIRGGVYDDTIPNATVPVLTGVLAATAAARLTAAGLTGVVLPTVNNAGGATSQNNGKVASQSPAAGTVLNVESEVEYSVYEYTSPPPVLGPITAWGANYAGSSVIDFTGLNEFPSDVLSNPTSYKVVMAGGTTLDGEYPITSVNWYSYYNMAVVHVSGMSDTTTQKKSTTWAFNPPAGSYTGTAAIVHV